MLGNVDSIDDAELRACGGQREGGVSPQRERNEGKGKDDVPGNTGSADDAEVWGLTRCGVGAQLRQFAASMEGMGKCC
eukprot:266596-Chlamydomonas_euryale.AAC.1